MHAKYISDAMENHSPIYLKMKIFYTLKCHNMNIKYRKKFGH